MRGLFLIMVCGCSSSTPCKTISMDPLLASAGLVRVDIYDAGSAHCNGSLLAVGAGPPLASRSFTAGQPIKLSLSPGKRTVVVTTFSDAAGSFVSGASCSQVDLGTGKSSCLSIELTEIDGGAGCNTTDDQCPMGQYCAGTFCASGCKASSECTPQFCDPTRHQCVECLSPADCPAGKLCTTSGRCAEGCDASHACSGAQTCCDMFCIDTRTDPLHCGGCGMACSGGDTLCCNGECANPSTSVLHCGGCGNACSTLHATPVCSSGTCGWSCDTGFAHCMTGNSGCDTDVTSVNNCGGCGNLCTPTNATANMCTAGACVYTCMAGSLDCLKVSGNTDGCESNAHGITSCGMCGVTCDTAHSMGADCPGTTCTYTSCAAGYSDCDKSGTNAGGCESMDVLHTAGVPVGAEVNYTLACSALGTPGNQSTYRVEMVQAACSAWAAAAGAGAACAAAPDCTGNVKCWKGTIAGTCVTWCYTKSIAGRVTSGATCTCPNTGSQSWN